jgi:enoyl-CoA hydratase
MEKFENLLTNLDNGIFTITINNPQKLNALNKATLADINDAMALVYSNKNIRAAIITGAGEKAFVAGADITEFAAFSKNEGMELAKNGHAIFNKIENCPKPVIAAVNGFTLGGGCELAMACHIRIASDNAKFGQPEVNLGIIPGYGGTQRLIQLIGKGKAFELLMTADIINAQEALQLGLINYLTTKEELLPKCKEIIEKIKSKSPSAIRHVINSMNAYFKEDTDGFSTEINEFAACFDSPDFKEGTTAFLEKRKAQFVM